MKTSEFRELVGQLDQNLDICVGNSFDFDNRSSQIAGVLEQDGQNVVKFDPYTIMMDIGAFCMLKKKEELLDFFLDKMSKLVSSSSNMTREQIVESIKSAIQIKMENLEKCIPPSL